MTHFDGKGNVTIYFALFEMQIFRRNIVKENWVTYLLSLLLLKIVDVVTREPDPVAKYYDYVKSLLLKRFKMTPEEFKQRLVTHKKEFLVSRRDFFLIKKFL